jgi:hypothetical protein
MPTTDELLKKRNDILSQFNDASQSVTSDDANRYLAQYAQNFFPLQQERRNLQAQAEQVLPQQLTQYMAAKGQGANQASPMAALNSIFKNQAIVRGQSDLIGDQINMGRGNLSSVANTALQQTAQNADRLKFLYGQADQDYAKQDAYDKQLAAEERQRKAAAAQQAAMLAAQYGAGNQEYEYEPPAKGLGSVNIRGGAIDPDPGTWGNLVNTAKKFDNKVTNTVKPVLMPIFNALGPATGAASLVKNVFQQVAPQQYNDGKDKIKKWYYGQ